MKAPRSRIAAAVLVALLGSCSSSSGPDDGGIVTLQNDSFTPGGTAAFSSGFVAGEAAGAFFPSRTRAYTVRKVQVLFGGNTTARTVTLALYAVTGGGTTRTPIYDADYLLTPSDAAFQEIDLSGAGTQVDAGEGLLVAFFFQHDGLPGVARDGNGLTAGRNFLYTSGAWQTSEAFLIAGDWVIRAEIED